MTLTPINGLNYHIETGGSGQAFFMLHGFTGSASNWLPLQYELLQYLRTVAPDLIGHGRTEAPPDPARYGMARAAADLIAIADTLNIERFHLLGYSMGGRLALYTALHYPERIRSLILESASPGLRDEAERHARRLNDEALADRIERDGVTSFVDYWETLPLWESQKRLPQAVRDSLRAQRLRNSERGLANSLRGMGTGVQPSLWEMLHSFERPALLITGAQDSKFTTIAQEMQAQMPRSTHVTFENAGHTVHLEKSDAYVDTIFEFLSSLL